MSKLKNFFATRWGIISVGAFIGVFAPLLQKWGNPGNMGICVACFNRDIAGAVGLHRAAVVQYMRPEIIGFVIGSLIAAYLFKEFRARGRFCSCCQIYSRYVRHDRCPRLSGMPMARPAASRRG